MNKGIDLKLFFNLVNETNDMVLIFNLSISKIIFANKKILEKLKYTNEEILELDINEIRKIIDEKKIFEEILINNKITSLANFYSKDGKEFIFESNITHYSEKNTDFLICISRDITKKFKKEKKLQDKIAQNIKEIKNQRKFLNTLMESNPTSIFYKDKNGKYLGCNKAWEELIGIKAKEVIGKTVFDISPHDIATIYQEQDNKVFELKENPQIYQSEVYNKKKDKRFKVIFYKSAYFDTNEKVLGLIGVVIDITDITELEKEKEEKDRLLYHKSKMEAMGQMIENITHQWRQPLSVMTTSASGIKLQKELNMLTDKNLLEFINTVEKTSNHLSSTMDDFKDFFKQTKDIEEFNIKDNLQKAINLLAPKFKNSGIQIIENIENRRITSLENELVHVILNILSNAIDAFNENKFDEKYIFIDCYSKNNTLNIEIKDNAKGIKNSIIDKIFEPYFTTKNKSHGTGIGLYMSKEIVDNHLDGNIEVENVSYKYKNKTCIGSKFIVKLPEKRY